MADTNGNENASRLDRIERIIEALATTQAHINNTQAEIQQDLKIILRAQVVMSENLEKLTTQVTEGFAQIAVRMDELAIRMDELATAQKRTEESLQHTDARMDALILTVDEIARNRKPP